MAKVIVEIGYTQYVLEVKQALLVIEALSSSERYERKYHNPAAPEPSFQTHHIYPVEIGSGETVKMQLLPDESYRLYKMAGKPKDN